VISVVPADKPVTTPVDELTVPTVRLLLAQVPPDVELVTVTVNDSHTDKVPPIVFGSGFTVTIDVLKHPEVIR
jgi:hypothetical protein